MEKKNYSKAEDFLLDNSFTRYIINQEDPGKSWQSFINDNPQLLPEIEAAKKLVKYLNSSRKLPVQVNKQEELTKLLQKFNSPAKSIKPVYRLLKYAAAVLILCFTFYFFNLHEALLYKEYTAIDKKFKIVLPDNTNINLREGTSLYVSRLYNITNRNVKLEGEAFFKVHKNNNSKFIVKLAKSEVTVLGTIFNIYSNPDSSIVSVKEGKVLFQSYKSGNECYLTKNMSALCNRHSEIYNREFNLNTMGWSTGEFRFSQLGLIDILNLLETYYPVQFIVNEKYKNVKLSFFSSNMELNSLMSLIKQLVPGIKFDKKDDKIFVI